MVTLVVSGLGSLSLVKRTPPWETDAAGATAAVYNGTVCVHDN